MRRIFREVMSLALVTFMVLAVSGAAFMLTALLLSLLYWPESPFD